MQHTHTPIDHKSLCQSQILAPRISKQLPEAIHIKICLSVDAIFEECCHHVVINPFQKSGVNTGHMCSEDNRTIIQRICTGCYLQPASGVFLLPPDTGCRTYTDLHVLLTQQTLERNHLNKHLSACACWQSLWNIASLVSQFHIFSALKAFPGACQSFKIAWMYSTSTSSAHQAQQGLYHWGSGPRKIPAATFLQGPSWATKHCCESHQKRQTSSSHGAFHTLFASLFVNVRFLHWSPYAPKSPYKALTSA